MLLLLAQSGGGYAVTPVQWTRNQQIQPGSEDEAVSLQRGQLSDAQAGAEEPGQAFKPDVAALEASDEAVQPVPAKVVAPAKAVRAKRAAKAAPAKMPRCRRDGAVEVVTHYTSQMFIIRL